MKRAWRRIEHEPKWRPGFLRIDAAGNRRPGFYCVHLLENGNGQCLGNVFAIEDEVGNHACVVWRERSPRSRMRSEYRRRRR